MEGEVTLPELTANGAEYQPCVSGYPSGCAPPPVTTYGSPTDTSGVSRERGIPLHGYGTGRDSAHCGVNLGPHRNISAFQGFHSGGVVTGLLAHHRPVVVSTTLSPAIWPTE